MKIRDDGIVTVAELGGNVGKSIKKGKALIRAARWAGASAVKIQLFTPDQMTVRSDAAEFFIRDGPWAGTSLWDLYDRGAMPHEFCPELMQLADSLGLGFVASIFHPDMVPIAEAYGIETYKVASFEIGYVDLLEALASTRKNVILSCGVATPNEIEAGVEIFRRKNVTPVLLKCTSCYPARPDQMNLLSIPALRDCYHCPVGLSDHTLGIVCAVVSVALGGCLIEKHIKTGPDDDGLDSSFSSTAEEFKTMVEAVRDAKASLGSADSTPASTQFKRIFYGEHGWIRTTR